MNDNVNATIRSFGQMFGLSDIKPEEIIALPLFTEGAPAMLDYNDQAEALLTEALIGRLAGPDDAAIMKTLLAANAYCQGTGDAWMAMRGEDIVLRGCFFLADREGRDLAEAINSFLRTASAWKEALDKGLALDKLEVESALAHLANPSLIRI